MATTHGKKYNAAAKNREIGTAYQAKQALESVKTPEGPPKKPRAPRRKKADA